jgi:aspartate/methionine/tyrosine aminotransferase
MKYRRMPIEMESPEESGYASIRCNLAESSVSDARLGELGIDLSDLVLAYDNHRGNPELRELLAAEFPGISAGDILLTPGAAAALFIVHTALLEQGGRLLVQFPNYATNLETPFAIGASIEKLELKFENGYHFSIEEAAKRISPQTRLISITQPNNPTGTMLNREELDALIRLAEESETYLLVDETYRDLTFGEKLPLAATLSDRVISISSVSKAHGLPGIRIGWLITKNKSLQEQFLAAKEQIFICNSVVDETIALRYLQSSAQRTEQLKRQVNANFTLLENWMSGNAFFEWVKPSGGVVCFPRFKAGTIKEPDRFYQLLRETYSTHVGPGHWFGMGEENFRIGFGWPRKAELEEGLGNLLKAAEDCAC